MLPCVAPCQVEGWWAVTGPYEGPEHTQLLTAGQPHQPLDAKDTGPLRTAWASGKESLLGRVCLGTRPAGEGFIRRHVAQRRTREANNLSIYLPLPT